MKADSLCSASCTSGPAIQTVDGTRSISRDNVSSRSSPASTGVRPGAVKRAEEYPERDCRRGDPRYQTENFDANVRAASAVRDLAAEKGVTPGQIALAWLLHKGPDVVPIPGTRRRRYLEENVAAAAVSLCAAEMSALDAALAPGRVTGPRYSEKLMAQVDR
jgi:aryl-alcohol dehydrogenase-like predicted oxidoreductase